MGIYDAPNKQAAEAALEDFADKWNSQYSYAVKGWRDNWEDLIVFYDFPLEIRNLFHQSDRKPKRKDQEQGNHPQPIPGLI